MDRKNWIKKKTRMKNKLRKSNNGHRLIIFRSNRHIYGQVLDVEKGAIVLSCSSNDNDISKDKNISKSNKVEVSKIAAETSFCWYVAGVNSTKGSNTLPKTFS